MIYASNFSLDEIISQNQELEFLEPFIEKMLEAKDKELAETEAYAVEVEEKIADKEKQMEDLLKAIEQVIDEEAVAPKGLVAAYQQAVWEAMDEDKKPLDF
jgi:hypothetical protein